MKAFDKQTIRRTIEEAIHGNLKYENPQLTGFSGKKLIGLLQGFAQLLDERESYLEVGVFQGLTLLSVAKVIPSLKAIGIDNFSQFDKENQNHQIVLDRMASLQAGNIRLLDRDYEDALAQLDEELGGQKVGLYFIDGPHDYRSQLLSLMLAERWLSDHAVIIVDDCNYHHVRQANTDFLTCRPEYKLVFESYSEAHPNNLSPSMLKEVKTNWWNGVNLIMRDPENAFAREFPQVSRDRILFENDHGVHSTRYAAHGPAAVNLMNVIKPFRPLRLAHRILKLNNTLHRQQTPFTGSFDRLNTFSKGLPYERMNSAL